MRGVFRGGVWRGAPIPNGSSTQANQKQKEQTNKQSRFSTLHALRAHLVHARQRVQHDRVLLQRRHGFGVDDVLAARGLFLMVGWFGVGLVCLVVVLLLVWLRCGVGRVAQD